MDKIVNINPSVATTVNISPIIVGNHSGFLSDVILNRTIFQIQYYE